MDIDFCVDALKEAIDRHGAPKIFNTDQGAQFTRGLFTSVLKHNDIKISIDGKGRWVDNVFVERLWRSVEYEEVYLHAYESIMETRSEIGDYLESYNTERAHQSLKMTPDQAYFGETTLLQAVELMKQITLKGLSESRGPFLLTFQHLPTFNYETTN